MELICAVQNYHWGKKGSKSLVGKFANANSEIELEESKPFAELWMGTHLNGPSYFKKSKIALCDHLADNPNAIGSKVVEIFGRELPFLFKILSIEEPLSIQAHPTKCHAEELFKKFPNIYKDVNHKPELAIALTKFEVLCGFRPISQIKHFLKTVSEFEMLIDPQKIECFLRVSDENSEESTKLMKDCFQSLMSCQESVVSSALGKLLNRLEMLSSPEKEDYLLPLVKKIYSAFPKDVGIFCVYWFNYLILLPGEALYLAPNEPHAYLYGDCVECMANSDNVVRAGLTPKFRDIQTLCDMLSYKNCQPGEILFHPVEDDKFCQLFAPPVNDFAVAKITLPKDCKYTLKKRDSASILAVIEGEGKLNSERLEFGKVFFISAIGDFSIESDGLVLFQAFCNV